MANQAPMAREGPTANQAPAEAAEAAEAEAAAAEAAEAEAAAAEAAAAEAAAAEAEIVEGLVYHLTLKTLKRTQTFQCILRLLPLEQALSPWRAIR